MWFFYFIFLTNILYGFPISLMNATCPSHVTPLDLIILVINHLAKTINYEDPHHGVVFITLLLSLSNVQILSPALCLQTPSISVLRLGPETKFNPHIEEQVKL
jgi:hypothetical protein